MRTLIITCALVAFVAIGVWSEASIAASPSDPFVGDRDEGTAATQARLAKLEAELKSMRAERDSAVNRLTTLGKKFTLHAQELEKKIHEAMAQSHKELYEKEKDNAALMQKLYSSRKELAELKSHGSTQQQEFQRKITTLSERHDRVKSILDVVLDDMSVAQSATMRRYLVRLVARSSYELPPSSRWSCNLTAASRTWSYYLVRLINDRDDQVREAARNSLREQHPLVAEYVGLDPWEAPPWPVDHRTMTVGEKNIRQALNRNGSSEFIDTPLSDVVDYLQDLFDITMTFDTPALEKAGVEIDSPITLNLRNATLRSTLRLVLEKTHPSLTYTVRDDLLLITTVESLKDMEVATYDVSELLSKSEAADVLAVKLQRMFDTSDEKTPPPCRLSIEGHGRKLIVRGPEWQQHRVAKLLTSLKPK